MITFATLARAAGALLADTLAPPVCAACDARLRRRAVLCSTCALAVVPATAAPGGRASLPDTDTEAPALPVVAFAIYGGPLASALRRLKYDDRPELAAPLGELLRHAAREAHLRADLVVPVPLHPARLAERGYNQAALLAAAVARELSARLTPGALRRTRNTAQQARLDRAHRLENVAGAFVAGPQGSAVHGRRVVLVDDVATTGSTLAACAEALREAGASAVVPLVVARAGRGGEE